MRSILLVSHGSKAPQAREEIEALAAQLKKKAGSGSSSRLFWRSNHRISLKGSNSARAKGATEITLLLNFLNSGRHAGDDIPKIIRQARKNHPEVRFRITKPIGQQNYLVDIFLKLLDEQTDIV